MEKIFFENVKFNACKVYKELHEIVTARGGYYCSDWEGNRKLFEIHRFDETKKPEIIYTYFLDWYAFILDGNYYYLSFKENPFLLLKNNKISRNYYCDSNEIPPYFDWELISDEEAKEIAKRLFNLLINAKYTRYYTEYQKKRVPNYYDGGFHYERVAKPERITTLKKS